MLLLKGHVDRLQEITLEIPHVFIFFSKTELSCVRHVNCDDLLLNLFLYCVVYDVVTHGLLYAEMKKGVRTESFQLKEAEYIKEEVVQDRLWCS